MKKLTTKQIALISTFADILIIVSRLPGIPILGGAGSIEFTTIFYPFIGIVMGPWLGMLAVLIGNFLLWLIPTTTLLGLLMIPAGSIAALASGLLSRKVGRFNWKLAAIVIAALNLSWYLTPVGAEAPFYPVLHWLALALVLAFRGRIAEFTESASTTKMTLGIALSSYIATMAEHMTGNLIFISAVGLVVPLQQVRDAIKALGLVWLKLGIPGMPLTGEGGLGTLFMLVLPVSAVERLAITALATFIGLASIRILGRARLLVPS